MAYLEKLVFDKETSRVYCVDTNGREYAYFEVCFNYWAPHTPIPNGKYEITHDSSWDMDYGTYQGAAYGDFWIALDRATGKGFHGWDEDTRRSLTSGTYGCVRASNDDGCQICRAIDRSLEAGIIVTAEVVGNVDEGLFCVGYDGSQ